MRRTKTFLALVLGAAFANAALAVDTNAVINAWLKAQADLKTWHSDFTQTRTMKTLSQPLVSTGQVWFARPSQFRWELGNPPRTIAVRDERQMLVIYPRLKRAERYPLVGAEAGVLGEALTLLDAGFPKDRATFDERFHVKLLTQTNGAWEINLEPARASTRRVIPLIRVFLTTNDFSVVANEILLPDGSRMRNDFTNATVNASFDEPLFKPELGEDFKITEPAKR